MKKLVQNWSHVSVYIAGAITTILALGSWDFTQRALLLSLIAIFLHFYEEFGYPGGFPWVGVKVLMRKDEKDFSSVDANNLSSMAGNWWFALAVYALPLFLPSIKFLTLAPMIFAFMELLMHLVIFNIALKSWYNPGLVTTLLGLVPASIFFFVTIYGKDLYSWQDYAVAFVWSMANFWIGFRSPIYKKLGAIKKYSFTEEDIFGSEKYLKGR